MLSHQVFGDGFMDFPTRLNHSPIFCAVEPQPDSQMPTLSKELADDTSESIMDWKNKLNEGLGRHPVWNMTLIQIPLSNQKDYDYTKCDIVINYLPKPNTANTGFVATGLTIPNLDTGKTRIEIYYTMLEVGFEKLEWAEGNKIYYTYIPVPVYLEGAIETHPQLEGIIRHEIGHSLGLGHYLISNDERERIVDGRMDMPSIMIDTTTTFGVTHYDITPLDISEIKLIYGNNGFHGGIPSGNFKKTDVMAIDKTNYNIGEPVDIQFNTNNFDENTKGVLLAIDPDGMLLADISVTKNNSTFQIKTDNKLGKYYVEFVDFGNDLYDSSAFTVSNGDLISQTTNNNLQDNYIDSQNSIFYGSTTNFKSNGYVSDSHHFSITPPTGWPTVNPGVADNFVIGFQNGVSEFVIQDLGFTQSTVEEKLTLSDKELADSIATFALSNIPAKTVMEKSLFRYSDGIKLKLIFTQIIDGTTIQSEDIFFWPKDRNQYFFMFSTSPDLFAQYSIDFEKAVSTFQIDDTIGSSSVSTNDAKAIPSWVKNNAHYWSIGNIGDNDFVKGIQYLIQQKIITMPPTTQGASSQTTIPSWVKKDAGWWSEGEMSDDDFIKAIQYLVINGIISP